MRHATLFIAVCLAFAPTAFSAESAKPVAAGNKRVVKKPSADEAPF